MRRRGRQVAGGAGGGAADGEAGMRPARQIDRSRPTARRIIEVRVAGQPMWAAIEDAGRLRDALGVALPVGIPEAFTEPVGDPLGDLVVRWARTHGPFRAGVLAHRYGLGVAVVTMALRRVAAGGRIVEGEFLGRDVAGVDCPEALPRQRTAVVRRRGAPAAAAAVPGPAAQGSGAGATGSAGQVPAGVAWNRAVRGRHRRPGAASRCAPLLRSAPRRPQAACRRGRGAGGDRAAGGCSCSGVGAGDDGAAGPRSWLLPRPARRADLGGRGGLGWCRVRGQWRRLAGARPGGDRAAAAARARRADDDAAARRDAVRDGRRRRAVLPHAQRPGRRG